MQHVVNHAQLSPRSGDHDDASDGRAAGEADGHDRVFQSDGIGGSIVKRLVSAVVRSSSRRRRAPPLVRRSISSSVPPIRRTSSRRRGRIGSRGGRTSAASASVHTAAAPDFRPVRLTQRLDDNGVEISDVNISDDGSVVTFVRGVGPNCAPVGREPDQRSARRARARSGRCARPAARRGRSARAPRPRCHQTAARCCSRRTDRFTPIRSGR